MKNFICTSSRAIEIAEALGKEYGEDYKVEGTKVMCITEREIHDEYRDEMKAFASGWYICFANNAAQAATIAALEADKQKLIETLNRICANPAVQDLIEKNPRTNYLIRDARALLAEVKGNHA